MPCLIFRLSAKGHIFGMETISDQNLAYELGKINRSGRICLIWQSPCLRKSGNPNRAGVRFFISRDTVSDERMKRMKGMKGTCNGRHLLNGAARFAGFGRITQDAADQPCRENSEPTNLDNQI
jgi:hypothetical protein